LEVIGVWRARFRALPHSDGAAGVAVASLAVDPDHPPEPDQPDLDAIASDLAAVEATLAQLEDGVAAAEEPPEPDPA
jgi:hypothetical protein